MKVCSFLNFYFISKILSPFKHKTPSVLKVEFNVSPIPGKILKLL